MHASNLTPTLLLTATVVVMLAVVSASPVVKPMVKSAYPFANIHTNDPVHAREEVLSRVKRQDISDRCNLADIIFVLDSSGSIGQDNWVKVLNFTKSIAGGFVIGPEEVQIGVVYYGNRANIAFHLNAYTNAAEVSNAIDAIQWLDQNTNTSGGIWMMNENMFTAENGKRDGVPALGIVITDGVSTRDPQFTIPSADAARDNNILMFAIGITDQIDLDELEGIANKPSEDFVFEADDFNALASIRDQVVQAACKAASECSENGDVVMLLDASGSVGFDNFQLAKNFVESLVMDANIDNGEARIGLATYASSVDVQFHLNTYNDRILMADAVRNIPYSQGTTNTGAAIQRAREEMFTAPNGNRSDRRDTLVIFTDGGSDDMANTLQQAKLIKQAGVTVLVVAVGSWTNKREIELMVSYPAELNTFSVSSFEDFASIKRPLEQSVCNDGAECSQGTCMNGGVCQDGINTFFCDCPQGFSGDRCQYTCNSNADVSIVLQSSSSLGEEDYYTMLKYSQAIARNLNLVSGQHRLAMETYATSPTARFRLNQFQSARDVLTELDFQYTGGVTNTQGALRIMNDELLSNGGRSGVAKVGVLLSDGFAIARDSVIEEAVRSHEAGTGLFSLGYHVKGKYSRQMLQGIGSDPDASNYMEGNSMQEMMDMMPQLIDGICQNAQACSSNPCQNGGICVEKFNTYECQCREPFTGINCERDCSGQLDLVLVIDSSGSIRQNRFDIVKAFIHNITAQLEVRADRVQVALLTYADVATQRFQFSTFREKEDVLHAIDTLPYSRGRTNAADAIRMMQGQMFVTAAGDRGNVPNIALVFTDGYSNVQKQLTVPRAIDARIEGTHIMVVSVENEQDNLELKGMVSDPDSYNLFNVNRYADLETIVDRVVDAMCDDVNECSSNPCQNGGQCVDGLGQFICICVNQWSGVRCERQCDPMRDIAIVLDASGSVDYDYSMAQDLAREVVHGLNFNNGRTKVSVVTYQSSDEVAFPLNQYNSKLEVLNALAFDNDITILGTNTAAALDTVRREVFSTANGDRSGVENWAVVISDGFSNINPGNTIQAADNLKSNGVTVVSVGLGTSVNRAEVDGIASSPESEYAYYLEDTQRLVTVASQILDQICQ